jgi:hypothetical protein
MLQAMKRKRWILALVGLIIAGALGADYGMRCWRPPLSKEEAIERANARLARYTKSFDVKETLQMTEATFERDTGAWLVTFVGPKCRVIIIADRCRGDDVGSTNACAS